MKHLTTSVILILGLLVTTIGCQKDDNLNQEQVEQTINSIKAFNLSENNIPTHILNYVGSKTNQTYKVNINNNFIKLSSTTNNAQFRTTPLGIVQTNKVVQVYNEQNIKYTFKVSDPTNAESVINLIVVDMGEEIIEYFIQYIFDPNTEKPINEAGIIDMTRFTGAMLFFDNEGANIGSYVLNQGNRVAVVGNTDPCDVDSNANGQDNSGGGGSSSGDNSGSSGSGYEGENSVDNDYNPCGLTWFYGECGCPTGPANGHGITGNDCCEGSPLVVTDGCTGETWNSITDSNARVASPCDGDAGVLISKIEDLKYQIEQCLEDNYNDDWFDNNNLSYNEILSISNYLYNNCTENSLDLILDFFLLREEISTLKVERYLELNEILEENPWFLIENCAEQNGMDTSNYLDLYNLPFPEECSDRLFNMGVEWHHQDITDGNVPLANIDYYGVEITSYPDFNNDGNSDSEVEMYQAFRENFTNLASGELLDFQFDCDVPGSEDNTGDTNWDFIPLTAQDGIDFISNNPLASILLIEADASGLGTLAADDGAVIVSEFTNNDWTISTIMTPNNGTQPFSGNRQWGWLINQNGNFEFFTRAVDVANISKFFNLFPGTDAECQQETYYNIAEATWENMQQEIVDWINSPESNGGQASIVPKKAVRVDKEKIEELLTSNESINEISCD